MDYNYMYPNGYRPAYQPTFYNQQNQTQQTQNNGSLIWVQGLEAAKSYLVAPNSTVTLWDSEASVVYLKSADASGMPSMKILDYTIRTDAPNKAVSEPWNDFATKTDVESIRKDIVALTERVNLMSDKKGDEVNG